MRFLQSGLMGCFLLLGVPASAQVPVLGPPPPIAAPVRDAQAVAAVQNAINALGGVALISQAQTLQAQGNVICPPGAPTQGGPFVWKAGGAEFRFEVSTSSGPWVFVTGHGKPSSTNNGTTKQIPAHTARAMFVPALIGSVLLRELQDPNYSIRYVGLENTEGTAAVAVTTAAETTYPDNVVTPQVWYIDASTGLPLRVEFRSPGDAKHPANFSPAALDFSEFRPVAGILYPFQLTFSVDGTVIQKYSIDSIQLNANVSPSDFGTPTGGSL